MWIFNLAFFPNNELYFFFQALNPKLFLDAGLLSLENIDFLTYVALSFFQEG